MPEEMILFKIPDGSTICEISLEGATLEEVLETKKLLAFRRKISPADIEVCIEEAQHGKK